MAVTILTGNKMEIVIVDHEEGRSRSARLSFALQMIYRLMSLFVLISMNNERSVGNDLSVLTLVQECPTVLS